MQRAELVEAVIAALQATQQQSGHDDYLPITEATVPIGDLKQFDSPNGVEATMALEERLGCELPVNLFTEETTRRPLAVAEVVDRLISLPTMKET